MSTHIKKIVITGGHITPAIATIEEIQKRNLNIRIVVIGRAHATESNHDRSHEREEIEKMNVRFYSIITGRFQRYISIHSFISFCKIPIGLLQATYYILLERPDCVVSFGGYIALPVIICAALFQIPIITHEQTSVVGLANAIIGFFAKKICITFKDTKHSFPHTKVVHTGLPLRNNVRALRQKKRIFAITSFPTIYITGGSTGSLSINTIVFEALQELLGKYSIVHQTGMLSYKRANEIKSKLPLSLQKRYEIKEYFTSKEVEEIIAKTFLVIGRSGANTTIELATLGKIALFIPLPWSGGDEQMKNAQWMAKQGAAEIITQSALTPQRLLYEIDYIVTHTSKFQKNAAALQKTMPINGAARFVDEIVSFI